MQKTVIYNIYAEFKETKQFTLPAHLLPYEKGFNLLKWLQELYAYYRDEGIILRPFDELPPLRLSGEETIPTTVQDVHTFIINDLNLIPLDTRKAVIEQAIASGRAEEAWQQVVPLLLAYLKPMDDETVRDELSWKFSPVVEVLHALTWIFMEREVLFPPDGIRFVTHRFPYYAWQSEDGKQALWEPENPFCRWEWLAFDLYARTRG